VIPARKRWGQHFLANSATAERIVSAAGVGPADIVLEIGPGDGALTRPLLRRGARVVAVEIDPLRAEALGREFAGRPRVTILEGDALSRAPVEWLAAAGLAGPWLLVANLPYNVGTPVLTRALESDDLLRGVVTVQREVARRFTAAPGDADYGYLSVRAAAFARARVLFDLPPGAFRPRPKVSSSVLELTPRRPSLDPELRARALRLASLGFRSRRKTLANALAAEGGKEAWAAALEALGRGGRARAEELSLEDYLELARR
jgi:16S rRNA (adenine1518-N6/adenine1519-N6)-dimethyltransferase